MPSQSASSKARKSNKFTQSFTLSSWRSLLISSMSISSKLRNSRLPSKKAAFLFTNTQGTIRSWSKRNSWDFILHASKRKSINQVTKSKLWQCQFHEGRISQHKIFSTTFYFRKKFDRFTPILQLKLKEIRTQSIRSLTGLGKFWDPPRV
jgi:hypothetical protein